MSKPKVLGEGGQKIFWPRDVISRAKNMLMKGLQFFHGHGEETNSHKNRNPVGEIVANLSKVIKGKLNQIVIGYFPDKSKVEGLDVCSIESDVMVKALDNNTNIASTIKKISAIALENSRIEKPAFDGSMRLATLQCFEGDDPPQNNNKNRRANMDYNEFLQNARFEWIQRVIKDKNIFPGQMYTEDDIRNDRKLGTIITDRDDFKTKSENLTKENETQKSKIGELEKTTLKSDAKERFESFLPTGLTLKQKQYIVGRFNPDKLENLSDESLKGFITQSQEDYKEVAKIFNIEDTKEEGSTEFENLEGDENKNGNVGKDTVETVLEDIME